MKKVEKITACLIAGVSTLAVCAPTTAATLDVNLLSIFQERTTDQVRLGHVVDSRTSFNRLTAGGTFTARCNDSRIVPTSGQNQYSDWAIFGGIALTVSIPENLPALVSMQGFLSLPRGTTIDCSYDWTAYAIDVGYSVSGQVIGGGETRQAGSHPFTMRVPGRGGGDWTTCIP
jgi:hypothetical protein